MEHAEIKNQEIAKKRQLEKDVQTDHAKTKKPEIVIKRKTNNFRKNDKMNIYSHYGFSG